MGGDSIYMVNASGIFSASINVILKMTTAGDKIREVYSSTTENIYLIQYTDAASGKNIPNLNGYVENGFVGKETNVQEATDYQTGEKVRLATVLPDWANGIVGVKVDVRDKNSAIFVNFEAIQESPIAEVAATIIHEEEIHILGSTHEIFGVGKGEGGNIYRDRAGHAPGSRADKIAKELVDLTKTKRFKDEDAKHTLDVFTPKGRAKSAEKTAIPAKFKSKEFTPKTPSNLETTRAKF